ncbi:probable 2-oxoglutarate-dependent dioxygenase AOP1 [Impatiens glandulifera]|uniref:probable 2-oxoglutarate-dependent dioxygenase AOP1 n=1 Tax=Impatiens glandulifera TaxID=253017 RepID=UPI001FB06C4F|nr:probable 2-oxoglutarate-dependent dioxygenase AOP1 [Impatiens glandulifera]
MDPLIIQPNYLPTIDFSVENSNPGKSCWHSTSLKVRRALEDHGCFIATYNQISPNDLFDSLRDLFDLPLETKAKNVSDKPFHGYFSNRPTAPLLESLGIEDAASPDSVKRFTSLMWPNGNQSFWENMRTYTKVVSDLTQMVVRMIFESYNVEKYYNSHVNSTTYLLRLLRYRQPQKNESNVGADVHTDKGFITVLHQDQVNGLEVRTKDNKWIDVNFPPSSFVVMAGDGLLAWSNGRVHAPLHKVIMKGGDEARYSLCMFSIPKGIVEIPNELVDNDHPLKFKPFDHDSLLRFFAEGKAKHHESTAKQFCGISE